VIVAEIEYEYPDYAQPSGTTAISGPGGRSPGKISNPAAQQPTSLSLLAVNARDTVDRYLVDT